MENSLLIGLLYKALQKMLIHTVTPMRLVTWIPLSLHPNHVIKDLLFTFSVPVLIQNGIEVIQHLTVRKSTPIMFPLPWNRFGLPHFHLSRSLECLVVQDRMGLDNPLRLDLTLGIGSLLIQIVDFLRFEVLEVKSLLIFQPFLFKVL